MKGNRAREKIAPAPPAPGLDPWLRRAVLLGVYASLLAPVILLKSLTAFPYVFGKTLVLQAIVGLTFPAWLILAWRDPKARPARAWIPLALAGYFAALVLATLFAYQRHRAFWGSEERMVGLFSLAHFFAWFLMAQAVLRTWPEWRRLLQWQAALGLLMAFLALLDFQNPEIERVAGTLGNAIYCATYQLFTLGILALLWLREDRARPRRAYAACALVSLVTLISTGSRGPLLGLFALALVVGLVLAITGKRWRLLAATGGAIGLIGVAYAIVVLTLVHDRRLAPFWDRHPSLTHLVDAHPEPLRGQIWAAASAGLRDRPLLGWGPGNYEAIFDAHFEPGSLCISPESTSQDSAHSALFDYLAATGAIGTLAWALLWAAVIASLVRAHRRGSLDAATLAALLGMAAGYLCQAMFIADSLGSSSMVFLFFALAAAASAPTFAAITGEPSPPIAEPSKSLWPALVTLQIVFALLVWRTSALPAEASHANLETVAAFRTQGCAAALAGVERTRAIATPWLDDQIDLLAQALSHVAAKDGLAQCAEWPALLAHVASLEQENNADQPLHFQQQPLAVAKLFSALGRRAHDPALLARAQAIFEPLIAASPRRQIPRIDFANLLGETGRAPEGEAQLEAALQAAPEMGLVQWNLGRYRWRYQGQAAPGAKLMADAVDVSACPYRPGNSAEMLQLARAYWTLRDRTGLRTMEARMAGLARDDQPGMTWLAVANYDEDVGLFDERDHLLARARKQDPGVTARLQPFLDGRVRTIVEAERLTAP